MRAAAMLGLALLGCSDPAHTTSTPNTFLPASSPGADRGLGLDRTSGEGGKAQPLDECTRTSDCARGVCTWDTYLARDLLPLCLILCAPPPFETTTLPIEPCPRGEVCKQGPGGFGVCVRPCYAWTDCESTDEREMLCGGLGAIVPSGGVYCQPLR